MNFYRQLNILHIYYTGRYRYITYVPIPTGSLFTAYMYIPTGSLCTVHIYTYTLCSIYTIMIINNGYMIISGLVSETIVSRPRENIFREQITENQNRNKLLLNTISHRYS